MLLKCEICFEIIGSFDPEKINLPIRAELFQSKDPARGEPPPPFAHQPGMEWEFLRCPICRKRPFLTEESVMTPKGIFSIREQRLNLGEPHHVSVTYTDEELDREWQERQINPEPLWECECGKAYQHQPSLTRHKKTCEVAKNG